MPKKTPAKKAKAAVKKAATKKAAPAKKASTTTKKAAKTAGAVSVKNSVGFRLRMTKAVHQQLQKKSEKEGVSQNTYINKLIEASK